MRKLNKKKTLERTYSLEKALHQKKEEIKKLNSDIKCLKKNIAAIKLFYKNQIKEIKKCQKTYQKKC